MSELLHSSLGPRLPQELLDIIVTNLEGDTSTLSQCALVSSRLHPLSEKLLYRKFTLGPPLRYCATSKTKTKPNLRSARNLLNLLYAKPYLSNYIHEITITNKGPLFTWLNRRATNWLNDREDDTIGKVIFQLRDLRKLSLIGVVSQASDDGYLDWLQFSGAFRLTMFYAVSQLDKLEKIRLEHVDNVPLALFDRLSGGMKELVLHGVAWAPDGYDPPERHFLDKLVESLETVPLMPWRKQKKHSQAERPPKPCQLETLCLHLHDSCYSPFSNYILDSATAPSLKNLKHLHCGVREPDDHAQIWQLVLKCSETLEHLEFFPAWPVSHEEITDHLDLSILYNLNHIYFNFFIQADSWGADDWAPWVAKTLAQITSSYSPLSTSPPPSTSTSSPSSAPSSKSPSPPSPLSLTSTSPNRNRPLAKNRSKMESIRIRLEFGFTEDDDLYVDLAGWRRVDEVLSFQDDFPNLKEVRMDVVCVDDGTRPFMDGLMVDLRAQFPKLARRGILRVLEGPWCSSPCLE